ncbi:MFS transporter [Pseudochelatococcus sp. G4_1912]|uniref:MFS transporter n=1 Tax=Pseudochelatococcus sp. G4_1912 TaxID=3114288 RepID=UPI0039C67FC5
MNSLFAVILFIGMGSGIISPMIGPLIFSDHGFFSDADIEFRMQAYSLIMGVYAFGQILGNPTWGVISDKIGGKRSIIWALAGSLGGYALCLMGLFYAVFPLFFIGRWIDGAMAGRRTIALAMISRESKEKTTSFKRAEIMNAAGLLLGPIASGALIGSANGSTLRDYSAPIVFMLLIISLNIILILRGKYKEIVSVNEGKKNSLFSGKSLNVYSVFFLFQCGWYLYFLTITPYIIIHWAFTPFLVGVFFSGLILFYILILAFLLPKLRKKIPDNLMNIGALFIGAISMALIGLGGGNFYLFLIFNAGVAIATALSTPVFMTKISNLKGQAGQGAAIGLQNSIIGFAWLIAAIFNGLIASGNLQVSFILGGAVFLISACFMTLNNKII